MAIVVITVLRVIVIILRRLGIHIKDVHYCLVIEIGYDT